MHKFCNIRADIKKEVHKVSKISDFNVRVILYLILVLGLILSSFIYDSSSIGFARTTILVAIASSAFEISSRLSSSNNEIKEKLDHIEEHGRLLMEGTAWYEGAKLISGLEKNEKILASNLVSWNKGSFEYYITENKEAMKRGVIIQRLYADNIGNILLANEQKKWGDGKEWKQNFKQILYDSSQPMIDHILAIDKHDIPKWAVLWIYSPNHSSTIIPGFIIKDRTILCGLLEDFNTKWADNKFAWQVPNFIINVKVVAVGGHEGKYIYTCEAGSAKIGNTKDTEKIAIVGDIIAVAADKITKIEGGFTCHEPKVISVYKDEDMIEPTSAEVLEEWAAPQKATQ